MVAKTVKEAWVEWALSMAVIGLRIFARIKVVGFRRFSGDDYFVVLAGFCLTATFASTLIEGPRGSNIGYTDAQRAAMTPEEIAPLVIGSKAILSALFTYAGCLWSYKACMLFLYGRLTLGLWQARLVKWNAYLCSATFLLIILVITCRCTPIQKTWQVNPDPGPACTTSVIYYVTTEVANEITDIIILCIPVPILLKVNLPLGRKLMISGVLCSGVFVFAVSIIRLVLTLGSITHTGSLAIWAMREMMVATLAVNAPAIKPLFSSQVWVTTSSNSGTQPSNGRLNSTKDHIALQSFAQDEENRPPKSDGSSTEIILEQHHQYKAEKDAKKSSALRIQKTTEFAVSNSYYSRRSSISEEDTENRWAGTGNVRTEVTQG